MKTVLIAGGGTGGHLMPALALAEALRRARTDLEPVLVGAGRGVERELLPKRGFRFHLLPLEPIYRRRWWRNARWLVSLPRILRETSSLLDREAPVLVVGTGGYAAGPVVWRAVSRGIPTALQEQNAYPGLTTRRLARHAKQVHLGFPEARRHLRFGSETKVFDSGNPITPPPAHRATRADARVGLGLAPDRPTVLVMGGSQGSLAMNEVVATVLRGGGFARVSLLWSVGVAHHDRYRDFDLPGFRIVRGFWHHVNEAYAAADIVVCRAGAMTTAEVCAWGLPAIYVPLPTAVADHQTINARALHDVGAAVLLPQSTLTAARLEEEVGRLLEDGRLRATMAARSTSRGHPKAAEDIIRRMVALVS